MNTETIYAEETTWNEEVVDNDALIAAIENDIANTRAQLSRLSEKEEKDDILFM